MCYLYPSIVELVICLITTSQLEGQISLINYIKEIAEILVAVATVIAFIVGGMWSYKLFVKKRLKYPRANITHKILHKPIPSGKVLLHVTTVISNTGDVLLSLISGTTRIQQMLPLSQEVLNGISEGKDPVCEQETEIEWPLLMDRDSDWKEREFEIEPGEEDQIVYDFIIDANVQTVVVYSYLKNVSKGSRDIGWSLTTVYDLKVKKVVHIGKATRKEDNNGTETNQRTETTETKTETKA